MSQQVQKSVIEQTWLELVGHGLKRKLSRERVIEMLKARIQRDQRYLSYRFNKGMHTAYDDTTIDDLPVLALAAAWLVEEKPETPSGDGGI